MFESLDDIEIIDPDKKIGEGAFSIVYKVRIKKTKEIAALKKVL